MYSWERAALDIESLGEIRGSVPADMNIEIGGSNRAAWWIATLFGPDFWTYWRVGLLRPTLFGVTDQPVPPPAPLILEWPKSLLQRAALILEPMDFIAVCPAIVQEKALAFAVMGATADEVSSGNLEPNERWALVSPTDLVDRLKIGEGDRLKIRLLPSSYRVHAARSR